MADIGSYSIKTDTGPTQDNISVIAAPGSSVAIGVDTLLNPVTVANISTADLDGLLERAKIALMDYFADNNH